MGRRRLGPSVEVDEGDDRRGVRGLRPSKVLKSLTAETLVEVARGVLVVGAMAAAVVVWGVGGWLAPRAARWMAASDGLTRLLASKVLEEPDARDVMVPSHIGTSTREMALIFGVLASLFAMWGGASGGLLARSLPRTAKAAGGGLIAGAVVSVAASITITPIYLALILRVPDATTPIAARALINSASAATCGLIVGLAGRAGVKDSVRLAAAGVMGASLGALLFGFMQIYFFPFESELVPNPRSGACRLVEYSCATLAPAVCIAAILGPPSSERPSRAEGTT